MKTHDFNIYNMEKTRLCSSCNEIITYSSISKKKRAEKNNSICRTVQIKAEVGINIRCLVRSLLLKIENTKRKVKN